MTKSVLIILINNQLNKEKPTKPENPAPAGSSNSNDSPVNDFTSTVTWHKRIKGISESDFNYIVAYHNGNESLAENMVKTCDESTLRNFIKLGKDKAEEAKKERDKAVADILWQEEHESEVALTSMLKFMVSPSLTVEMSNVSPFNTL